MMNVCLLTAEICWRVWGTPANFNIFHVLAALLHGTLVVGVSQTAALNRGRHLYSAGRPSRWALAHILVYFYFTIVIIIIIIINIDLVVIVSHKCVKSIATCVTAGWQAGFVFEAGVAGI